MSVPTRRHTVATSHGSLAVEESGAGGTAVLFIHGNSSCCAVFRNQLEGRLAEKYRLIAFDLPGHGESSDAPDPIRSYTRGGFADAAVELLGKLSVSEAVVLGWSLGGHIAIDMISRFPGMRGLMIVGAPPVGHDNMARGFARLPQASAAGREHLSGAEIDGFVEAIYGAAAEPFLRDAVARADGRFRKRLFEAVRAGGQADQRVTVKESALPIAMVNGAADRMINLDYIDTVAYGNLWEGHCHRLTGLGHAPFFEAPDVFNPILERFLRDVEAAHTGMRSP